MTCISQRYSFLLRFDSALIKFVEVLSWCEECRDVVNRQSTQASYLQKAFSVQVVAAGKKLAVGQAPRFVASGASYSFGGTLV